MSFYITSALNSLTAENEYIPFYFLFAFSPSLSDCKEILSLKRELHDTADEYEKYAEIRAFYKEKLVDLGVMKNLKTSCKTIPGHFIKK